LTNRAGVVVGATRRLERACRDRAAGAL